VRGAVSGKSHRVLSLICLLVGYNLNVRADPVPGADVSKMVFIYDGVFECTEGSAPHAAFGDSRGDCHRWTPNVGDHTLMAAQTHSPHNSASVCFHVVGCAAPAPAAVHCKLLNPAPVHHKPLTPAPVHHKPPIPAPVHHKPPTQAPGHCSHSPAIPLLCQVVHHQPVQMRVPVVLRVWHPVHHPVVDRLEIPPLHHQQ